MANQPLDSNDPLKGKKTGKWTKYGGAVHGMVKESIQDKWYCQSCGEEMPEELKPFLFELYPGDFIRICNLCMHAMHKEKNQPVIIYKRTVTIFRKTRDY
jgi:hypothetical protein